MKVGKSWVALWLGTTIATVVAAGAAGAQAQNATENAPALGGASTSFSNASRLNAPQPLNPTELLGMQSIGGNVLRARGRVTQDPDEIAFQQEIDALRRSLQDGLALHPDALSVMVGGAETAGAVTAGDDSASRARMGRIRPHLTALSGVETRLRAQGTGSRNPMQRARRKSLAGKAAELQEAVSSALAAPESERYGRTMALYRRLQARSLSEEISARSGKSGDATPSPAPTITTLTRHR